MYMGSEASLMFRTTRGLCSGWGGMCRPGRRVRTEHRKETDPTGRGRGGKERGGRRSVKGPG